MLYRTYRYSQWDGTQRIFELDADELMDRLSDDILNKGDVMQALRDLRRRGLSAIAGLKPLRTTAMRTGMGLKSTN